MLSADDFIDTPGKGGPRIGRIRRACADFFGVSEAAILGPARHKRLAMARQTAYWLARRLAQHSYSDIGRHMGRDHSTVMHGVSQIAYRRQRDEIFRRMTDYLENELLKVGKSDAE